MDSLERGLKIGYMLATGKEVTTSLIREMFNVSRSTARRDIVVAELALQADATIGPNREVTLKLRGR